MVSGGMSCIKYLLFAFNLVFVIFGILLLYAGFTTVAKIGKYEQLLVDAPNGMAVVLILVGFAIFMIAFLGCCGAIKESYCMLTTFSSIIVVILLIELIGAGIIFAFKSKLKTATEEGIKAGINKFSVSDSDLPMNKLLDEIQESFDCCGANNYTDWYNNSHFNESSRQLPASCCRDPQLNQTYCLDSSKPFTEGCVDKLDDAIRSSFGLLGGIAIAVAVIQLIGIVFACGLSRSIKKEYEVV